VAAGPPVRGAVKEEKMAEEEVDAEVIDFDATSTAASTAECAGLKQSV
jgi:hypothetical protein